MCQTRVDAFTAKGSAIVHKHSGEGRHARGVVGLLPTPLKRAISLSTALSVDGGMLPILDRCGTRNVTLLENVEIVLGVFSGDSPL